MGTAMALRKKARRDPTAALVESDEKFDARVVQSLVDLRQGLENARGSLTVEQMNAHFEWLPPVLKARADRAGIPAVSVAWDADSLPTDDSIKLFWIGLFQLFSAVAGGPSDLLRGLAIAPGGRKDAHARRRAEEWVNEILLALPIRERLELRDGAVIRHNVPLLTTLTRCLAYAYARVIDPNSPLFGRLRACADKRHGIHCFLAVGSRRDKSYCTAAHQNAHAQFRHRQRLAAEGK